MGAALLRGWLDTLPENDFSVIEPQPLPQDLLSPRVQVFSDGGAFSDSGVRADIFVLAVKPQVMNAACAQIKPAVAPESLVLSIAAGQDIESFQRRFHPGQPIVRAMPNTPAAIGAGVSVAVASDSVTAPMREAAQQLLRAVGKVLWIGEENLMNAVTALSGSGPAYVFLLMEILAEAGRKVGLDAALAATLARETVIGSALLAAREEGQTPEALRRAVTSPGGTTQAALEILMDGRLQGIFDTALTAARDRGQALRASE